ncbi:MAG: thermonuclease family protein, partial [Hyphomicrobiales bacterium]
MKFWDLVKASGFILIIAALVIWFDEGSWEPLESSVRVVDGDSLAIGQKRLRLVGIDAPELQQTCLRDGKAVQCGLMAKQHLAALVA